MPGLADERFAHGVILVCAHSTDGAMGIVINKPADHVTMPSLFRELSIPLRTPLRPAPVYAGGPVDMERGFVLHTPDYDAAVGTLNVSEEFSMSASLDVLEDIAAGCGPELSLLALGYCGWAPGQLEAEIAENGWLTGDVTPGLVFSTEDDRKWELAMTAQGIDPRSLSAASGRA
ncbi:YqgE/AlgH family protein [Oceanicola sp. S124]|uniref:YqgE/AlgH family protein n=1 Tax=Oceanicola sp. S124 TaxID=1042378 RepID=UPI0002559066|nr:YqgE/AlgH family protein [Oceanicola sp. S124]